MRFLLRFSALLTASGLEVFFRTEGSDWAGSVSG